jgi:glucosyl-3-phosphoglycerate synthase
VGVRREWLETLPIWTGYGLEIGMLLETYKRGGLEAIGEADLGVLLNRSQPLADLGPMAYSVLLVVARQLEREGRLEPAGAPPFRSLAGPVDVEPIERPAHAPAPA